MNDVFVIFREITRQSRDFWQRHGVRPSHVLLPEDCRNTLTEYFRDPALSRTVSGVGEDWVCNLFVIPGPELKVALL